MSDLITDEDVALMHAEIDAGARGDALQAYRCHEAGLQLEGGLYRRMLRELVILGDEAPAWMYSRWCLDLAYRWMLIAHDPRIDEAVRQLRVMSYLDESERLLDDPRALGELGTRIAAGDRLSEELALQEYGGLYDFIDVKAEDGLVDRCDHIAEWAVAELGGYVIEGAAGSLLRVVDLSDNRDLEVLNIGAMSDCCPGQPVIGRLGPISSAPGLMFQRRPLSVDFETAQESRAVRAPRTTGRCGFRRSPRDSAQADSRPGSPTASTRCTPATSCPWVASPSTSGTRSSRRVDCSSCERPASTTSRPEA